MLAFAACATAMSMGSLSASGLSRLKGGCLQGYKAVRLGFPVNSDDDSKEPALYETSDDAPGPAFQSSGASFTDKKTKSVTGSICIFGGLRATGML